LKANIPPRISAGILHAAPLDFLAADVSASGLHTTGKRQGCTPGHRSTVVA